MPSEIERITSAVMSLKLNDVDALIKVPSDIGHLQLQYIQNVVPSSIDSSFTAISDADLGRAQVQTAILNTLLVREATSRRTLGRASLANKVNELTAQVTQLSKEKASLQEEVKVANEALCIAEAAKIDSVHDAQNAVAERNTMQDQLEDAERRASAHLVSWDQATQRAVCMENEYGALRRGLPEFVAGILKSKTLSTSYGAAIEAMRAVECCRMFELVKPYANLPEILPQEIAEELDPDCDAHLEAALADVSSLVIPGLFEACNDKSLSSADLLAKKW